jgi:hypothetical protein
MVDLLLFSRMFIIGWTWMAVSPIEFAIDALETELERRGVPL